MLCLEPAQSKIAGDQEKWWETGPSPQDEHSLAGTTSTDLGNIPNYLPSSRWIAPARHEGPPPIAPWKEASAGAGEPPPRPDYGPRLRTTPTDYTPLSRSASPQLFQVTEQAAAPLLGTTSVDTLFGPRWTPQKVLNLLPYSGLTYRQRQAVTFRPTAATAVRKALHEWHRGKTSFSPL